jgi:hypothetical protein
LGAVCHAQCLTLGALSTALDDLRVGCLCLHAQSLYGLVGAFARVLVSLGERCIGVFIVCRCRQVGGTPDGARLRASSRFVWLLGHFYTTCATNQALTFLALQASEQYLTASQFLAHALRHVMTRSHATHTLLGKDCLLPLKLCMLDAGFMC